MSDERDFKAMNGGLEIIQDEADLYYEAQSMHSHLENITEVVNTSFSVFKEAKSEWMNGRDRKAPIDQINNARKHMDAWAKTFIKGAALKAFVLREIRENKKQDMAFQRIKIEG